MTVDELVAALQKRRLKWRVVGRTRCIRTIDDQCPLSAWSYYTQYPQYVAEAVKAGLDALAIMLAADGSRDRDPAIRRKLLKLVKP